MNTTTHNWILILEFLGEGFYFLFFLLLLYMTFQLAMSLRVLLQWSTLEKAAKMNKIVLIILISGYMVGATTVLIIAFELKGIKR